MITASCAVQPTQLFHTGAIAPAEANCPEPAMTLTFERRDLLRGGLAGAGLLILPSRLMGAPAAGFTHGVASGDPGQREVTLWTRYVAPGAARLRVEVSEDAHFRRSVVRGEAVASVNSDFCAKVRVAGLRSGRRYHYRFVDRDGGARSVTGTTRTLPEGRVDRYRIAVVSCANATSGWFNAYAHIAARDDIDLVVHLGDYIYESPIDRSDALPGMAAARGVLPAAETVALADYRARYGSYRADADLAALHARHPMISVWDDHETANNAWRDGARGHGKTEGSWEARKAAGMRAYDEWMPMGRAPYDRYRIGDLATLFRLETRLVGRDRQLDVGEALAGPERCARGDCGVSQRGACRPAPDHDGDGTGELACGRNGRVGPLRASLAGAGAANRHGSDAAAAWCAAVVRARNHARRRRAARTGARRGARRRRHSVRSGSLGRLPPLPVRACWGPRRRRAQTL
jgi:hypothetical protein